LLRLPGVKSVEQQTDQDKIPLDLLYVQYDPAKASPEVMLQTVDKHESKLKAKIVPAP
jgi:hypothetical protein